MPGPQPSHKRPLTVHLRAAHVRPLQRNFWIGCCKNDFVGSGLDRSVQLCGRNQRPGGVKTPPYKIPRKWLAAGKRTVCRGGIHASRVPTHRRQHPGRDKSLPYGLPCRGRACPARGLPINARLPYTSGPHMCGPYNATTKSAANFRPQRFYHYLFQSADKESASAAAAAPAQNIAHQ